MSKQKQQDDDTARTDRRQHEAVPVVNADADTAAPDDGADALNDARALQQMIEGTPDSSDEFRRIERKR